MNRGKIAQYIALGATALSLIGIVAESAAATEIGGIMMTLGFVTGLVSYGFGGLGTAFRMSKKLATFGWFVVPFPYDIATFIVTFIGSIFVFIFIPIIPVRKAYKEKLCC